VGALQRLRCGAPDLGRQGGGQAAREASGKPDSALIDDALLPWWPGIAPPRWTPAAPPTTSTPSTNQVIGGRGLRPARGRGLVTGLPHEGTWPPSGARSRPRDRPPRTRGRGGARCRRSGADPWGWPTIECARPARPSLSPWTVRSEPPGHPSPYPLPIALHDARLDRWTTCPLPRCASDVLNICMMHT
jgi:hypothetical protein